MVSAPVPITENCRLPIPKVPPRLALLALDWELGIEK
jgi:hypothetical protein